MILELDRLRAFWLREYGHIGPACGRGDKRARLIIEAFIETGLNVVVVWGPPGSGKSTVLKSLDKENTLVFECTGLVKSMNKFLRGLPKEQVSFVCKVAPRSICRKRVLARKGHPMGDNGEYLATLVDKWFDTPKKKMLG